MHRGTHRYSTDISMYGGTHYTQVQYGYIYVCTGVYFTQVQYGYIYIWEFTQIQDR